MALPGETWPTTGSAPMHALCQLNLTELPFCPARLADLEMITVFVGPAELPVDEANGSSWCLRAYKQLNELRPLEQVDSSSSIKPFPMTPRIIDEDYPCLEDVAIDLPADVEDDYYDLFKNVEGFKLAGWPSLIQSAIYWAPWNQHPASPEYVFQIDSSEKANWMWGDCGVGYFGRGTVAGHVDDWTLQWQCY